ncbi:nuclear transport factor 2 family protein [Siccirubricoccus phaeus]|uniref:nuclear transport factor 2 family protein n=1 Tax=Siccirubricoccus phaeus TaxID=2595053 RepID=UPI00165CD84F|nr:nuclear transport factor 2 family protein [Siccirubricoccus phaeus]
MRDADKIRAMLVAWAEAVAAGDRAGILADHARDVLMFDFPNTVKGIDAYDRTWDFFDASRRSEVTFRPGDIQAVAGSEVAFASCEIHCAGTTADPIDFRLTMGFCKEAGRWVIVHEHHSMPTTEEVLIGPDVA